MAEAAGPRRPVSLSGHGIDRFEKVLSRSAQLARGGQPDAPLQRLTPATRVLCAALLLTAVVATASLGLLAGVLVLCCVAALAGRVALAGYVRNCLLLIAFFVAPVALLGSLSWFTPGAPVLQIGPLVFTESGLYTAALLCLRALAAVAVTTLLVRSAGMRGIVEGLRPLAVPESVLAVLQMCFAHIHLLGRTAQAMVLGMRARTVRAATLSQAYRTVATQGVVLLERSTAGSREVHAAMLARGFAGRFSQAGEGSRPWTRADVLALCGCAGILILALILKVK